MSSRLVPLMYLALLALPVAARADVKLLAKAAIPGNATDLSGLTNTLEDGTPMNRLGGFSGLAYTGYGHRYVLLPDRGPGDGVTAFPCRFHAVDIAVNGNKLNVQLLKTNLLRDKSGNRFVGLTSALGEVKQHRFDPEGIRVGLKGTVYISDEYGPFVYAFDGNGKKVGRLPVPERFMACKPSSDPKLEAAQNRTGRVPNRGFEGLAINPEGTKLLAALQGPLIQDGGRDGVNTRLLEIDINRKANREYVYVLAAPNHGISEILSVNDREYLVLERDGKEGRFRKIIHIDIGKSSNVESIAALPVKWLPKSVVPVSQKVFLDFLTPRFGLGGKNMPTKIEGLAFGPDLPDGRRLLLVACDNDFLPTNPSVIYAFAIDRNDLPGFRHQQFAP